jgi:putative membrane protein
VGFLIRLIINGVAVMVAAYVIPGLQVATTGSAFIAGVVLGLVNALVRPLLIILTLPFTLITLGLFIFVVNAICLGLVAWLVPGFSISGFGSAFLGALVITLVSWLLNGIFTDEKTRAH